MNARLLAVVRSKTFSLAVVGLVVLMLAGGGLFVWNTHRKGTVEYALQTLNQAIATKNTVQLAHMVRFDRLADQMAEQILATKTVIKSDDARQEYADIIQRKLFDLLSGKLEEAAKESAPEKEKPKEKNGEKGEVTFKIPPAAPLEDEIFSILKKPLPILPGDLHAQLIERPFALQASDGQLAVATTTVQHPALGRFFPLRIVLLRKGGVWYVDEIGNGDQLVKDFLEQVAEKRRAAEQAFEAENARQRTLIDTFFHVESCRAVIFPESQTHDLVRLRVTVAGRNMGDRDLVAAAALCELKDKQGQKISTLRLESPRRVGAGETFEQSWMYNFETRFPEVEALLQAQDLTCVATPITASLGGSKLLYPRSLKDLPGVRFE